jgi:hypothetical protein
MPWYVRCVLRKMAKHHDMVRALIWNGFFQGKFGSDPELAKQLFQQHNQRVQQVVPAHRLLVFNVREGWAPLCAFLGKPVPDEPFPHQNERVHLQNFAMFLKKLVGALKWGLPLAGATAAAAAAWGVSKTAVWQALGGGPEAAELPAEL